MLATGGVKENGRQDQRVLRSTTEQAEMQRLEMLGEGFLKNLSRASPQRGRKCAHNTPLTLTICSEHLGALLIWWP